MWLGEERVTQDEDTMQAKQRPIEARNSAVQAAAFYSSRRAAVWGLIAWLAVAHVRLCDAPPSDCPSRCSCDYSVSQASCVGVVPRALSTRIKTLKVRNLRVEKIDSNTLRGLENLEELHITEGRVPEISEDCFSSLSHLKKLNLSNNGLTIVPRKAFSDCSNLNWLDLSRNPLVVQPSGAILVSRSLSLLDLSHCGFTSLPEEAFSAVLALTELNLRYNAKLISVPRCILDPLQNLQLGNLDPTLNLDGKCASGDGGTERALYPTGPDVNQNPCSTDTPRLPADDSSYRHTWLVVGGSVVSFIVVVSLATGLYLACKRVRLRNRGTQPPVTVYQHQTENLLPS